MYAIEMESIVKQYPLVRAVDQVNFNVIKGEVHCLLGENGAGKTTLMKILYGMTAFDEGSMRINNEQVVFKNPTDAIKNGISMVHQHFQLTPVMSVAENVVVGQENQNKFYFSKKKAIKQVDKIIKEYGFHIDASQKVEKLSVGEQQRVEIIKALYRNAQILILDEPTAVLTPQEVEELFKVIRKMRSEGLTVIIITHKLKEAIEISDRVSVMRDGAMIESGIKTEGCTVDSLAKMMVGRDVSLSSTRRANKMGEPIFEIKNLYKSVNGKNVLDNLSLTIRKGEILGIAGVEGNGQTELIEAITGLTKTDRMSLKFKNQELAGNAAHFIKMGIGHVPENRLTRGLVSQMSIKDNLILGYHTTSQFSGKFLLNRKDIEKFSQKTLEDYRIKAPNIHTKISALSGGNQQKVVIGRVFSQNPEVIVVAQPTRGVDVGAMEYIHNVLLDLRDAGTAILLISADLDEVLRLSDTVAVLYEGKIVKTVPADTLSESEIGQLMLGTTTDEKAEVV